MYQKILTTVVVSFLLANAAFSAITVIDQDTYNGHSYYKIADIYDTHNDGVSWFDAESYAINSLAGHLATINDLAENQWLFDRFIGANGDGHLWLGYTLGVGWVADGENVMSYSAPWYPGEPNGQDKLMMLDASYSADGLWNDHFGTVTNFTYDGSNIYGLVEVPEPATLALLALGGIAWLRKHN